MALGSVQVQTAMSFRLCQKNFFQLQIFDNRFFVLEMKINYVSVFIRGPQINGQSPPEVWRLHLCQNILQEHLYILEGRYMIIRNK